MPHDAKTHRVIRLADGRHLGFVDTADPRGLPLLVFHGTPNSRLDALRIAAPARRTGWRLIAPDRPGHGLSDPRPDRRLLDWPSDVRELTDALGFERFSILGFSGGAAHALVTAYRLPGRVISVAVVSGWGPIDRVGAYEGVRLSDRLFDRLVERIPRLAGLSFRGAASVLRRTPRLTGTAVARGTDGGHAESTAGLAVNGLGPAAPFLEAFRRGTDGAIDDYTLLLRPWGFDPVEIGVPVRLWHGDADRSVPAHHAEDLARRLPDAHLTLVPGEDHALLYRRAEEIFADLRTANSGAASSKEPTLNPA